ncbi:LuxR C-terminal-related transcriptional regulator [Agromyces salentinus]|uniref:LuxR C-terminal-related transcriptional regulator n=1 Tax=Agromyces salentinus TaxID=269421 RepID=UPI001478DCCA|nr:LuxR C-terminal-related transcriptional regulator [Agromyces salentinus]
MSSEVLVDRPALVGRLAEVLGYPLTMIVAQAGAGKTVLLQQWADTVPDLPMAWIDVEPEDDDPMRFSRRLLMALSSIRPEVAGLAHMSALGGGGLGGPLLERLGTAFAAFPESVIVLDDLHHLSNGALMADLGRLAAVLPPQVHLVISTRADPPIAWSRLRLRHRILELRQADLTMTRAESATLLAKITGREFESDLVDTIVTRTEGWAAGLQLAALTLKFQESPAEFVAELSGSERLIAEYLAEEVLDALPERGRMLLLRMAPLDVMTAELVDHVLERSDARQVFERLEHESLFLVAIDPQRTSFRFHHLFRDLLRYRLRSEDPAEKRRLLGRAADFHLARGELTPAIEYLLRAADWDRALDAIMTRGSDIFERGEMRTVIRWITSVPEHVRAGRLDVQLELGILVGMAGETVRAVDALDRVARHPNATSGERVTADAWISATAQWSARPESTLRAAERALAGLDAEPGIVLPDLMRLTTPALMRTLATGSGGRSQFLLGDLAEAEAWMDRALATDGMSYPPFRVGMLGSLALLHAWSGRTVEAELLAVEAIGCARATSLLSHPIIADAHLAQAMTAYERGRSDVAGPPLEYGVISAEGNGRTQMSWIARLVAAHLAGLEGRFDDALELTDLSSTDAASAPAPAVRGRIVAARMSALRRSGRAESALRLHEVERGTLRVAPSVVLEAAAAALAAGRPDAAKLLLSDPAERFRGERPRGEAHRLVLRGWIAALEGARPSALDLVGAALGQAEPHGLVALFLESDPVVLDLVQEHAKGHAGFAEQVLHARGTADPAGATGAGVRNEANHGLTDPLTERELEILAFLPDHSTTAELARMCFVSVNTMKTHTAHIYRKLEVSGRSAAVARARELGLLPLSRSDPVRA